MGGGGSEKGRKSGGERGCVGDVGQRANRTFALKVVALAAEEIELLGEAVELLADGFEALVEAGLALLLGGALGGLCSWL